MGSLVASTIIRREFKHELFMKTKKSIELSGCHNVIKGKKIILKPDIRSEFVVPGLCTSPWIIESVIKVIKKYRKDAEIILCERNIQAIKNWGVDKVCKENGVKIVDLSKEAVEKYKGVNYPKIVLFADEIINLPVVGASPNGLSGCLVNQARLAFEQLSTDKIIKINKDLNPSFCVADGTICSEGFHPYVSYPLIRNSIISGVDSVSVDNALCVFTGLKKPHYLKIAEEKKLGSKNYKLIGSLSGKKFRVKKIPANNLLRKVYSFLWFKRKAKKLSSKVMTHDLYKDEFKSLI
ncbi:MAG: DUF362 domain-containing protein [Nanobdellota archaeon]